MLSCAYLRGHPTAHRRFALHVPIRVRRVNQPRERTAPQENSPFLFPSPWLCVSVRDTLCRGRTKHLRALETERIALTKPQSHRGRVFGQDEEDLQDQKRARNRNGAFVFRFFSVPLCLRESYTLLLVCRLRSKRFSYPFIASEE